MGPSNARIGTSGFGFVRPPFWCIGGEVQDEWAKCRVGGSLSLGIRLTEVEVE